MTTRSRIRGRLRAASLLVGAVALAGAGLWVGRDLLPDASAKAMPDVSAGYLHSAADEARVSAFCGDCHQAPRPDTFPKAAWPEQVAQGYTFFQKSGRDLVPPPKEAVVRFYQERAPEALPVVPREEDRRPWKVAFRRGELGDPAAGADPAIANVHLLRLDGGEAWSVVACEMNSGTILAADPESAFPSKDGKPAAPPRVLSRAVKHPGHVEMTDLDGDHRLDLLVAELGTPMPSDDRKGAVVWLKQGADGAYSAITLASGLGRVADIQAADFDGDGDQDLVVAEFGWRDLGAVLYFENRTGKDGVPKFEKTIVDPRHGAIHVPIADLDGDGKPDFVAAISQEHETIVAFLNRGPGRFEAKALWSAPHPAFGLSGMQLVDLDGDKDLDVLLTSGDAFDTVMLRPDNGVTWLENRGDLRFEPIGSPRSTGAPGPGGRPGRRRRPRHRRGQLPAGGPLDGHRRPRRPRLADPPGANQARRVPPAPPGTRGMPPRDARPRRLQPRRQARHRRRSLRQLRPPPRRPETAQGQGPSLGHRLQVGCMKCTVM